MSNTSNASRRVFLQRMGQLSAAGVAAPWAANLAAMGDAAAFNAGNDYKALVCIFMYGGNDNTNTLVPVDASSYAQYSSMRRTLATPLSRLAATTLRPSAALNDGRQYALAPELAPLKSIFDAGDLAVQLNVGPLIQPTTIAQYRAQNVPLPPKLGSHSDQQMIWQSSQPEVTKEGWGGKLGDLAMASNGANSSFTCMSASGQTLFLSGERAFGYSVGPNGAVALNDLSDQYGSCLRHYTPNCASALQTILTEGRYNVLEYDYNQIFRRSISAVSKVNNGLNTVPGQLTAGFPNTQLGKQLATVARLIAARNALGVKRQVYFVSMGGFDTHDAMTTKHPALLAQVGNAMAAFYQATKAMGIQNQVTTFTASEFGRTMETNGAGSEHGWGGEHFIMGGAVKGGRFYGKAPNYTLNAEENVRNGMFLPTTSVDQFAATLAKWFGVADSEMGIVLPNLKNFNVKNMGFMA